MQCTIITVNTFTNLISQAVDNKCASYVNNCEMLPSIINIDFTMYITYISTVNGS